MSADAFQASKMKLERANKFIHELRVTFDAYANDTPLCGAVKIVDDHPQIAISWKGIGLLPGAIIGDAVHNMRTALDLMASELARLNGQSDKNVYFPFASSEDDLSEQIKAKSFHRAGADAVNLLRGVRPYKGGNDSLRAIHDLDIADKHTALIPAHTEMDFELEASIEFGDTREKSFPVLARKVEFIFPPDGPLGGMPVLETLEGLVKLVCGIIEAFSDLVASRAV